MKRFQTTVFFSVAIMVAGILISSFITPAEKLRACEDTVYGYTKGAQSQVVSFAFAP
jgi:hypothetical protein